MGSTCINISVDFKGILGQKLSRFSIDTALVAANPRFSKGLDSRHAMVASQLEDWPVFVIGQRVRIANAMGLRMPSTV